MRWAMTGDWPCNGGALIVPAGAVIEARTGIVNNVIVAEGATWNGHLLPLPMPLNAQALDNEAARLMINWYPEHRHALHFGPEVAL
jgi:hypothetical protein